MSRALRYGWLILAISTPCYGKLVWESTFAHDADGVVNVRTDGNPSITMIGPNTGGDQTIVTTGRKSGETKSNKAGRPLPSSVGANDSFSAYYKWDYTGYQDDGPNDVQEVAGFISGSSPHSTREFMGASFIHYVDSDGNFRLRFGGRWASEGNVGSGRYFVGTPAGDVNFGKTRPIGMELQTVVAYDGGTKFLTTNLYDDTGTLLKSVSQDIRLFDNLGATPDDPALMAEVNQLTLTHLGWEDFGSGDTKDLTHTWSASDLAYYNDATGAFGHVSGVPEPTAAMLLTVGALLLGTRRRRQGRGC